MQATPESPRGFDLEDLEVPVTPPVTDTDVVEPNVGLIVATVVLVICCV
ncbi:MAG: hypothetical protein AAF682_17940 [Planctomycetota bacterium]